MCPKSDGRFVCLSGKQSALMDERSKFKTGHEGELELELDEGAVDSSQKMISRG